MPRLTTPSHLRLLLIAALCVAACPIASATSATPRPLFLSRFHLRMPTRRALRAVSSPAELRARIADHRLRIARLQRERKDLAHERAFLEKTLELKKGQRTMQDGQVKLSQAELEDKAKEIAMYRREAPRTLQRYNQLVRMQRDMQHTLNRLHHESHHLSTSRQSILQKIHTLSMRDLVERHTRNLPHPVAGALRKSAAALVPFFDYVAIAADTNNRLVDHVGAEIDRYTHVNISGSPFMSGVLFYCVLLIPVLTIVACVRRVLDTSSKLTATHFMIFGNLYFFLVCLINLLVVLLIRQDPIGLWFQTQEHTFILANLCLALYYVWHICILGLQAALSMQRRDVSQLMGTLSVGVHYYLFTWRPVFTDTPPNMYVFNYMMYATVFAFILYERLMRVSDGQLQHNATLRTVCKLLRHMFGARSVPASAVRTKDAAWSLWTWATTGTKARRSGKRVDRLKGDKRKANREDSSSHSASTSDSGDMATYTRGRGYGDRDNRDTASTRVRSDRGRGLVGFFLPARDVSSNEEASSDDNLHVRRSHGAARVDRRARDRPDRERDRDRDRGRDRESKRAPVRQAIWKWS